MQDIAKAQQYFAAKVAFTLGPVELHSLAEKGSVNIMDVRAKDDYDKEHVPGAKNLTKDKWDTFEGLDRDKTNIIYCYSQTCHLAANAAVKFASYGFPVMELEGGFEAWKKHNFETEHGAYRESALLL